MNIWGKRYAEFDLFIGHCRDLNVKTDRRELEHYEKIGVMLPVARVVYPDEYASRLYEAQSTGFANWDNSDKWADLDRLLQGINPFPFGYENLSDAELVHSFDRVIQSGGNPHLVQPSPGEFRPWSEYSAVVSIEQRREIHQPTAKHFYGYWQVHQLAFIQQFPDLFENADLIARVPEDDPFKRFYPRAVNKKSLLNFKGMRDKFDALSFWVTVYNRGA